MPTRDADDLSKATTELLQSFSHPLRLRIYYCLAAKSSASATQLAQEVGTTAQLAYYHLTRLAALGVVEPDAERPRRGRERYWRVAPQGTRLPTPPADVASGTLDLLQTVHRAQAALHFERFNDFYSKSATSGPAARRAAFSSDMILEVTEDELVELQSRILEVLQDYPRPGQSGRTADGSAVDGRISMLVFVHGVPLLGDDHRGDANAPT